MFKYGSAALAIATLASAASSQIASSCQGTSTIQNGGDATAIGGCPTFSGDIVLATTLSDNNIDLGQLETIEGNLVVNNVTALSGLSGGSLTTVSSQFELFSVTVLTSLSFPQLSAVGTINWNHLPVLQSLSFGDSGITEASVVSIQDTGLQSLNGIDLEEASSVLISQNRELSQISLNLANVSGAINIAGNGRNLSVDFPQLTGATNITIQNASSISLPGLQFTNTTLAFLGNSMQSIFLPNLTTSGDINFSDNEELSNITMTGLTKIMGGLSILNNPAMDVVNGFGALTTVTGAIDMAGNFSDVEFPQINLVQGAFNLQSTGDLTNNCSTFRSEAGANLAIKGNFVCNGSLSQPGGAGTTPSASSGSGSATSKSAAEGLFIRPDAAVGIAGVLAAMLGML